MDGLKISKGTNFPQRRMDPYARYKDGSIPQDRRQSTKGSAGMPQGDQENAIENASPQYLRRASTGTNKTSRLPFVDHGSDSVRSTGSMDRTLSSFPNYSTNTLVPPRASVPSMVPNPMANMSRVPQVSSPALSLYSIHHGGSFSHSEASSDNSSFPDSFSLAGDSILPDIPPVGDVNVEGFDNLDTYVPTISSTASHTGATATRPPRNRSKDVHASRAYRSYGTSQSFQRLVPCPDPHSLQPSMLSFEDEDSEHALTLKMGSWRKLLVSVFDPSGFLSTGMKFREDGTPYFDDDTSWSVPAMLRLYLYNPVYPEFTSVQQFTWAVIIGIAMGVFTATWKMLIERCVLLVWKDIPTLLLEKGYFSSLEGAFPIYHYMWICPSAMGAMLSYISASLPTPIPGQNEWINSLHARGIQEYDTFWQLFLLSTAGMASGLSLGPELPLVLAAGMFGSWLGVLCKQSMLQARVLNLTAASAAIGGFFGFPMAGALFVLELPHRMGLQYFEALSPATIASIVAVLTNRLVTGNDVTGYYEYPFLNETLPSEIFTSAIIFGLFGGAVGIMYAKSVMKLKHNIHEMFQDTPARHQSNRRPSAQAASFSESLPLVGISTENEVTSQPTDSTDANTRHLKGKRAAATGAIAGSLVGLTCMFIPHVMFWGEAQLQTLIDKGRTPLPVFGRDDDPSAGLVALGYCVESNKDSNEGNTQAEFTLGCSITIALAKTFVTGLSLGTGIVGGHFWGPLFVGCAMSHFLTDFVARISSIVGLSTSLSAYPCVALLCIMGSTHVVTFRAHIAIILILTLTIDAFNPEGDADAGIKVAGDYSAVFPLLTVAVFVSCQISRRVVFYEKQRSRGDIMATPEVLCEPGKEGSPFVIDYEGQDNDLLESSVSEGEPDHIVDEVSESSSEILDHMGGVHISRMTIEANFEAKSSLFRTETTENRLPPRHREQLVMTQPSKMDKTTVTGLHNRSPLNEGEGDTSLKKSLDGLDKILGRNIPSPPTQRKNHRRTRSEPVEMEVLARNALSQRTEGSKMPRRSSLKRVDSFGQVDQEQPSLLDQARRRCASFAMAETSQKLMQKQMTQPVRKHSR